MGSPKGIKGEEGQRIGKKFLYIFEEIRPEFFFRYDEHYKHTDRRISIPESQTPSRKSIKKITQMYIKIKPVKTSDKDKKDIIYNGTKNNSRLLIKQCKPEDVAQ